MEKIIRFALVGTGMISKIHSQELLNIENAKITAVFSPVEKDAKSFAEKLGAAWYTDFHEMLKSPDIDVVNILTPSGLHGEMTIDAARAGKHVIVEKPMDISLEKAREMIQVCRENQVKLCVISQHRFDPSSIRLKSDIKSGQFGKTVLGQASINWYRPQSYFTESPWRGTWEMNGGGVLINQGIHTIDLLQFFMGEVESVYAHTDILAHQNIEVEDVAVATVKFKNGAFGTIVGTTAAYPGLSARLEIIGTNGTAVIENDTLTKYYLRPDDDDEPGNAVNLAESINDSTNLNYASAADQLNGTSHRLQFIDMIDAIKNDREPLVNGVEGYKALEVIKAIYQSSESGKPVLLSEMK